MYPEKNLYWLEKRHRTSPDKYDVVSVYYMLEYILFQAPTLSHVIDTRINNSIFFQKKAFEMLQGASDILYTSPSTWTEAQQQTAPINEGQDNQENTYTMGQTHDLDFIFEIAEAPFINNNSSAPATDENEEDQSLTELEICNVWQSASKLHLEPP